MAQEVIDLTSDGPAVPIGLPAAITTPRGPVDYYNRMRNDGFFMSTLKFGNKCINCGDSFKAGDNAFMRKADCWQFACSTDCLSRKRDSTYRSPRTTGAKSQSISSGRLCHIGSNNDSDDRYIVYNRNRRVSRDPLVLDDDDDELCDTDDERAATDDDELDGEGNLKDFVELDEESGDDDDDDDGDDDDDDGDEDGYDKERADKNFRKGELRRRQKKKKAKEQEEEDDEDDDYEGDEEESGSDVDDLNNNRLLVEAAIYCEICSELKPKDSFSAAMQKKSRAGIVKHVCLNGHWVNIGCLDHTSSSAFNAKARKPYKPTRESLYALEKREIEDEDQKRRLRREEQKRLQSRSFSVAASSAASAASAAVSNAHAQQLQTNVSPVAASVYAAHSQSPPKRKRKLVVQSDDEDD